ncbi:MAG: alanine--glyoxylate aminotransferase family protein [Rhodothermales bacterium]
MLHVKDTHRISTTDLDTPPRLLLGPGPSNAHPRVLRALSNRQVGHLDPTFLAIMGEVQELLRYAWQTDNPVTIPVSGTGSAAMEAAVANTVEAGDSVVIGVNGYFGMRLVDMAGRYGAKVHRMDKPWGEVFSFDALAEAVEQHKPRVLMLVHAETSTGARQPLDGLGELCRQHDCLLLIDTVTSLGGVPLFLDEWGVDVAYSGTQKCLSCPPGLGPLTLGPRAMERLAARKTQVPNWYLDLSLVGKYWGKERTYHHTAPINMNYGLREALRLVAEEGLEARWERHARNARLFWDGLEEMGLSCHVAEDVRLPSLTTVRVPDGVDSGAVARELLSRYNIEIAGGLGELAGKVWRVGLMGFNSRPENIRLLLSALKEVL